MMGKLKSTTFYISIKHFTDRYERFIMPGTMVLGFLLDVITFKSIEVETAFLILGVHMMLVTVVILYINIYDTKSSEMRGRLSKYLRVLSPFILQFSFGALLSSSLIFYSFSSALTVSWPLLGILAVLMVANEIYKQYYLQPTVQISVYYLTLFSTISIVLPFLFASVSPWIFVISGVLSIILVYGYIRLLIRWVPDISTKTKVFARSVLAIYVIMNIFYFTNIVPPVPLNVRDGGVYHQVSRVGGEYNIVAEKESFLRRVVPGITMHTRPGDRLYVYIAIYAPTELDTDIVHDWQYHDDEIGEWVSVSKPRYSIVGGRRDGYRGYSFSSGMREGRWRVYAETVRGQVIGKVSFRVKYVDELADRDIIVK
jgi:hypothetical protein